MPHSKGQRPRSLRLTLAAAAREFRVHRHTLRAALVADGRECGAGSRHSIREVTAALFGDEERARTRDLEASARLKEQKHDRLAGELVLWSEVELRVGRLLGPIREAITSARATLPARVNPADPHLAREAIEQWETSVLAKLRDEAVKAAMGDDDE